MALLILAMKNVLLQHLWTTIMSVTLHVLEQPNICMKVLVILLVLLELQRFLLIIVMQHALLQHL